MIFAYIDGGNIKWRNKEKGRKEWSVEGRNEEWIELGRTKERKTEKKEGMKEGRKKERRNKVHKKRGK